MYLASLSMLRIGGSGSHSLLDSLRGTVYIVWYMRALGGKIGKNVCLYPAGADPMMTEPDMVEVIVSNSLIQWTLSLLLA